MSENGMSLANEGLGEELTEIPKPYNGYFQLVGLYVPVEKLVFVIVRLRGVDCANT